MDVYTIPPNFAQEGTLFSGRVRFRNAFEAGILGVLLFQILLSMDWGIRVKIYVGVAVLIPALIFAVLGGTGREPDLFFVPVCEICKQAQDTYGSGWEVQASEKPKACKAKK